MQLDDLEARLCLDPGQRTLGQLLQERTAAAIELRRLRLELAKAQKIRRLSAPTVPRPASGNALAAARPALLRLSEVCRLVGLGRSTIYRRIKEKTFPAPLRVGDRSVRWAGDVIDAWRDALESASASQTTG